MDGDKQGRGDVDLILWALFLDAKASLGLGGVTDNVKKSYGGKVLRT